MKCYKLLNQDMTSYGGYTWALGEWEEADWLGTFCAPGGFHGYAHPILAVLHNYVHAGISDPRLFEAEADGEIVHDGQMQLKAQRMRVVSEIPVPIISLEQMVTYAIFCAKAIYRDPQWNSWADSWLSGGDRSQSAAESAAEDSSWHCDAATLAADAAMRAALVADELCAADAEEKATLVLWVAVKAVEAAAAAARAGSVDLIACAERAMGAVKTPGGDA